MPASPHIAARMAGIGIDLALIQQEFAHSDHGAADLVVVEGAGRLARADQRDRNHGGRRRRARACRSLLVVGLRLGCLNHALLTAQAIEASRPARSRAGSRITCSRSSSTPRKTSRLLERRLPAPLLESVAFDASGLHRLSRSMKRARQRRLAPVVIRRSPAVPSRLLARSRLFPAWPVACNSESRSRRTAR